jgi:uncharacterized protein
MLIGVFITAAAAFILSACVGLGGSLILVPVLGLMYGPKTGIALAAIMLAANNVAKVVVYRRTLPIRPIAGVICLTVAGAYGGALLMTAAAGTTVGTATIAILALTFVTERTQGRRLLRLSAPVLAFLAGLTSGFAGTSGPLKGLALRGLTGDRLQLAGAASVVSLVGDVAKTAVYLRSGVLDASVWPIAGAVVLLVPFTATLGRHLNVQLGESRYGYFFWLVMLGYALRLAF